MFNSRCLHETQSLLRPDRVMAGSESLTLDLYGLKKTRGTFCFPAYRSVEDNCGPSKGVWFLYWWGVWNGVQINSCRNTPLIYDDSCAFCASGPNKCWTLCAKVANVLSVKCESVFDSLHRKCYSVSLKRKNPWHILLKTLPSFQHGDLNHDDDCWCGQRIQCLLHYSAFLLMHFLKRGGMTGA